MRLIPKTHFERVPLEIAKKAAEEEFRGQELAEKASEIKIGQRRNQPMSDGELKFPEWQVPLQEVILEFDLEKLNEKVQKIETLIAERFQELQRGSDGRVEQQALNDALSILRVIKRDRLGFPDWKQA